MTSRNGRDISHLTKLHIACGGDFKGDYINVDLYDTSVCDVADDCIKLEQFPDNFADEIFHMHFMEHVNAAEGIEAIKNWYRVLKPGGKLVFETPEADETFRFWLSMNHEERWYKVQNLWHGYRMQIWGSQDTPGQQHYIIYDKPRMIELLTQAGFKNIYCENINDPWLKENMHVEAYK